MKRQLQMKGSAQIENFGTPAKIKNFRWKQKTWFEFRGEHLKNPHAKCKKKRNSFHHFAIPLFRYFFLQRGREKTYTKSPLIIKQLTFKNALFLCFLGGFVAVFVAIRQRVEYTVQFASHLYSMVYKFFIHATFSLHIAFPKSRVLLKNWLGLIETPPIFT